MLEELRKDKIWAGLAALFSIATLLTVCTPSIASSNSDNSLNIIGSLIGCTQNMYH